jgi:alkanesulfonate monooxygenase SsuD/methylene tetrahydromethanopterin reductase-like flavin-dependent oxidoreductase (luciferase family)
VPVDFGIFMTIPSPDAVDSAATLYGRAIEMAVAAEQLGFTHVWLAEHHFTNYSTSPRPLVLLSHLAAKTRSIRLGTAIVPVPLHHPLIVAEELALVDVLSGGRVDAGLGKGYAQYQYDRLGLAKDDQARFLESLDVIELALTQQLFEYHGEVFEIPETRLYPQPIQARMPMWLVVNTSERFTVAEAARRGMNLFTGVLEPLSKLTHPRNTYPELFPPALDGVRIGTQRPVYVAETDEEAREVAEQARWNGRITVALRHKFASIRAGVALDVAFPREPDTDTMLDEYLVVGTPETCIRQLQRIRDGLGADYFSCSFWFGRLSHERVLASMSRFARDVLPALRR